MLQYAAANCNVEMYINKRVFKINFNSSINKHLSKAMKSLVGEDQMGLCIAVKGCYM